MQLMQVKFYRKSKAYELHYVGNISVKYLHKNNLVETLDMQCMYEITGVHQCEIQFVYANNEGLVWKCMIGMANSLRSPTDLSAFSIEMFYVCIINVTSRPTSSLCLIGSMNPWLSSLCYHGLSKASKSDISVSLCSWEENELEEYISW